MSIVFYDRLIVLNNLDKRLKKLVSSNEELQELWLLIEEMMHHRIMGCVLDKLPREKHPEFLEGFHKSPHDQKLLKYLKENIEDDVEEIIKKEVKKLHGEILAEIKEKRK